MIKVLPVSEEFYRVNPVRLDFENGRVVRTTAKKGSRPHSNVSRGQMAVDQISQKSLQRQMDQSHHQNMQGGDVNMFADQIMVGGSKMM